MASPRLVERLIVQTRIMTDKYTHDLCARRDVVYSPRAGSGDVVSEDMPVTYRLLADRRLG